ncbi:hypothetical protein JCM33374_g5278 [Metschnikowia sp. JCM 33374]|nr:hypothetical protein JCM33374_g5278 [Metschnikowia sp. JCM 33374]
MAKKTFPEATNDSIKSRVTSGVALVSFMVSMKVWARQDCEDMEQFTHSMITEDVQAMDPNYFAEEPIALTDMEGENFALERCAHNRKEIEKYASKKLLQIHGTLKDFFRETHFDFSGFEKEGENLQSKILKVSTAVRVTGTQNQHLSRQLRFIQRMFQSICEEIELLKYYKTVPIPGYYLVWALIDLKIRLFTMRNLQGEPDIHSKDYVLNLQRHKDYLNFLKIKFPAFEEISFGTKTCFFSQVIQVEKLLEVLGRQRN